MKAKKSLSFYLPVLLIFLALCTVTSCSNEMETLKNERRFDNNRITYQEFLNRTRIRNFPTKISVPKNMMPTARMADGSYEITDFDIDVNTIKANYS